jgi:ribulose-bisphosphate carboxylase large chain
MPCSESPADPSLCVTYAVQAPPDRIEARAQALLLEQTVELPRSAIREPWVSDHILGRVELIEPDGPTRFRVEIAHPLATTSLRR